MHQLRKRLFLVVLLARPALVFRLAIPAGFMPGVGADHQVTLKMCHGAGPLPAAPTDEPQGHEAPCAYAASATTAPPPAAIVQVAGATGATASRETTFTQPALRPVFRAQSPRAPPLAG